MFVHLSLHVGTFCVEVDALLLCRFCLWSPSNIRAPSSSFEAEVQTRLQACPSCACMTQQPFWLPVVAVEGIPPASCHGRSAGLGPISAMEAQPSSWRTTPAMPLDRLRHDYAAHGCRLGDEVSTGLLLGLGTLVHRCQASTNERSMRGLRAALLLDGDQSEAGVLVALVQHLEGLAVAMTGRPRSLCAKSLSPWPPSRARSDPHSCPPRRRGKKPCTTPSPAEVGKTWNGMTQQGRFHCTASAGVRRSGWVDG